jgi:hypothetical protein
MKWGRLFRTGPEIKGCERFLAVRYLAGAGAGAAGLVHLPSLQQGHLQSLQTHFSPPLQGHFSQAALSHDAALSHEADFSHFAAFEQQLSAAWAGIVASTPKDRTNANSTVNNSVFFMVIFLSCYHTFCLHETSANPVPGKQSPRSRLAAKTSIP